MKSKKENVYHGKRKNRCKSDTMKRRKFTFAHGIERWSDGL